MIQINSKSSTPIYEQIQKGLKTLISKGALREGEKLPSIRELACILTTNPNTISKAYSFLEKEGIINTLKGKGTFVNLGAKTLVSESYLNDIKEDIINVINKSIVLNLKFEELILLEKDVYSSLIGGNYAGN